LHVAPQNFGEGKGGGKGKEREGKGGKEREREGKYLLSVSATPPSLISILLRSAMQVLGAAQEGPDIHVARRILLKNSTSIET
jgi:hypothetical protein